MGACGCGGCHDECVFIYGHEASSMSSPDIQPLNGVVHALNYNYLLVKFECSKIEKYESCNYIVLVLLGVYIARVAVKM
ncbi:MAG: hypothetical protein ACLU4J_20860 [Butyricimonas paravirosa]